MTAETRQALQALSERWLGTRVTRADNRWKKGRAHGRKECAEELAAALQAEPSTLPTTTLLEKAIADRGSRPWRYYYFERDDLMNWLEKVADERDALKAAAPSAPGGAALRVEHLETAIRTVIDAYGDCGWAKSEMCRFLRKALAADRLHDGR